MYYPPQKNNTPIADLPSTGGKRKRLQSMDLLKFMAIFLVLWGHAEQYLVSDDFIDRAVYRHIYSFHMSLFMMISGFFFAMTIKPGVMKNVLNKARQLILPAVCWTIIFGLLSALIFQNIPSLRSIAWSMFASFWFLKSAFACSLLGLFPFVLFRKHFVAAAVITLLISQACAIVPLVRLASMYPAFLTGGIIYMYHDRFRAYARWIIQGCGFVWIVCNLFLDSEAYRTMTGGYELIANHSLPEIAFWRIYSYTMALCGATAFIALFEIIFSTPRSGRVVSMLSEWGKMTLGIYIFQAFLLENLLANTLNFDNFSAPLFDFVIAPLIALIVMLVSVAIIRFIRLNSYASFFLLGTKWPNKSLVWINKDQGA